MNATGPQYSDLPRLCAEVRRSPSPERAAVIHKLVLSKPPNYDYRLAFIVARILSSTRLKKRAKWCDLAKRLIKNPGVSNRLIDQSMKLISLQKKEGLRPQSH